MVDIAHVKPQVAQWHAATAVGFVAGNVGQVTGFVMQHQHLARHHLDLTDTHHVQCRVGNPRNDVQRLDAAGRVPGQRPVFGRGVVNRNHGQLVVRLAFAKLVQNPVPVGLADLHISLFACVPALVQGFGRHGVSQRVNFRQDFKATVENEFGVRVGTFDGLDQGRHAGNLLGARCRCFGHQRERIQRIQKKRTVTGIPQRLDHLRHIKR